MNRKPVILALAAAGMLAVGVAATASQKAQINGSPGFEAGDVFGVQFTAIDGRNIPERDVMWLKPGEYEVTVRIPAKYTAAQVYRRANIDTDDYATFAVELEPGQTYEVRGRYNRSDRDNPYDVTVHRVER